MGWKKCSHCLEQHAAPYGKYCHRTPGEPTAEVPEPTEDNDQGQLLQAIRAMRQQMADMEEKLSSDMQRQWKKLGTVTQRLDKLETEREAENSESAGDSDDEPEEPVPKAKRSRTDKTKKARRKKISSEDSVSESEELVPKAKAKKTKVAKKAKKAQKAKKVRQDSDSSDTEDDTEKSLQAKVRKRMAKLQLLEEDSIDSEDSDRGKRHRHSRKSGAVCTADDGTKLHIKWPEAYVRRGIDRNYVKYEELTQSEFSSGYMRIAMDHAKSKAEKRHMLQHYQTLMDIAIIYPWPVVRGLHRTLLQQIEQGDLTWGDREQFQEIRARHLQEAAMVQASGGFAGPKEGGKQQKKEFLTAQTAHYCFPYQGGACQHEADHYDPGRGRMVHHICSFCHSKLQSCYRHPEKDCRKKEEFSPGVPTGSKNGQW
jgi:hypothetical protein